jgi:glyoxylase-like metal-dependent hydrolase (beta-lactamase superfamily II)
VTDGAGALASPRPMAESTRIKELGRGERVLPGLWRLRLPLPWPGVPHCNAWAIAAGDGIVLVDTGMHEPGSFAHLERALGMCRLRVDHVRLVVCTHAHSDHYGQAGTIIDLQGCELWMHPNHRHTTAMVEDLAASIARRMEVGRQSGVPASRLKAYEASRDSGGTGISRLVLPDRELLDGVRVDSDLGEWVVYETPGHAPSHVCLFQPERRLLISGDHLLGRISLHFEYGWSADPVGQFLASLDRVEALDARLCLAGHGRTFTDVAAHIAGTRELVAERLDATRRALAGGVETTAFAVVPEVFGPLGDSFAGAMLLAQVLCYLAHLRALGEVERLEGETERWRLVR